jgi:hypothetical protein
VQARERRWCLEFETADKARRLLGPFWRAVLAALDMVHRLWRRVCAVVNDIALGLAL